MNLILFVLGVAVGVLLVLYMIDWSLEHHARLRDAGLEEERQ
jgi:hypothetical protein